MRRQQIQRRSNWQSRCEEVGFTFWATEEGPYWDESAYWEFTETEIDQIETATADLHAMCLHCVEAVMEHRRYEQMGIPDAWVPFIEQSWNNREPSLYGRFDLCYDGRHPPKLLEYNADTPTSLLETSVVQWVWLEDCFPRLDQFNSIHEKLIERWKTILDESGSSVPVHFACARDSEEDLGNVQYLRDTATQAGADTRLIYVDEIGWSDVRRAFVDNEELPILQLFKLYPWEWIMQEPFGVLIAQSVNEKCMTMPKFIEPAWKRILSNKAILPILWEMFPDHELLLPAYFPDWSAPMPRGEFVQKPILAREGANITLYRGGQPVQSTEGAYGEEGFVFQEFRPLPVSDGNHAVIGSWIIGDEPAGIGIREDTSPITRNTSRFVPHLFKPS